MQDNDIHVLQRAIEHRGPDDQGFYQDPQYSVAIGMRRLSIIDVGGGHQPIANEDETIWVVFNGEIYNYQELRQLTESRGHAYRTNSDTEVLVHLYEEYGPGFVERLRGMFAFAILDRRDGSLFIARDRLGIKPLYYWQDAGRFIFGSEIKAILACDEVPRRVDPRSLAVYLALQYVPPPHTMFEGIAQLPPGHTLTWRNGKFELKQYWHLDLAASSAPGRVDLDALRHMFSEAVRLRMIADVPLGALLSGGIDSASVVSTMRTHATGPLQTFTVGFDAGGDEYSELKAARDVARYLGTEHQEVVLTMAEVRDLLPTVIWHLDEPLADQAALPTYAVCRLARQSVKVVLTGEGGDEVFGGYPRYGWHRLASRLQAWLPAALRTGLLVPLLDRLRGWDRSGRATDLLLGDYTPTERYLRWVGVFHDSERRALLQDGRCDESRLASLLEQGLEGPLRDKGPIHGLIDYDVNYWLAGDILPKVDKMSMACSLEARVPLLDHKLVEMVAALPQHLKAGDKRLLRQMMAPSLPAETVNRRKHAFAVPMMHWLQGGLLPYVRDVLLDPAASGFFQRDAVEQLLRTQSSGQAQQVWTLLCFELWHRAFIAAAPKPVPVD